MSNQVRHSTILEELQAGHSITIFTVGTSMQPLLKARETHVTIQPLQQAKPRDILLYVRTDGALVLHRLIRQDEAFFYMRGDNTYGLEKLPKAQAFGVATHIFRKGKTIDIEHNTAYARYVSLWNAIYPIRLLAWSANVRLRKMLRPLISWIRIHKK